MPHVVGLDDKNVYSVDMMHAYINIFKPKVKTIKMNKINVNPDFKLWDTPDGQFISMNDLIKSPDEYPEHKLRVDNANLDYPIIIDKKYNIIDGAHRYLKSYLYNINTIKVIPFSEKLLKKFLLNSESFYNYDDKDIYYFIELFYKRFKKSAS